MVSKRTDGFAARESGAAAFDWVILAVGVFGLGLAVISVFTADLEERPGAPPPAVEQAEPEAMGLAPLYPYFDMEWRRDQSAYYAGLDDAALMAEYMAQYAVATGEVNARIGADFLSVIEEEMTRRGLPVPEDHDSAAAIRARMMPDPTPP